MQKAKYLEQLGLHSGDHPRGCTKLEFWVSDAAGLHRKKHTFRPIILCHLFGLGAAIPHITFNTFVSSSLVTKRFQKGGTTRARTTQDKKHLSRTYASLVVESVNYTIKI
jgi:hypothetical protein